jgi:outer membrane protein OmpA-like peptidoglycan-associated protein
MTERLGVALASALLVAACATEQSAPQEPDRLNIVQVATGSAKEFMACVQCPARTTKTVALPSEERPAVPKASDLPKSPVAAAPAPKPVVHQIHFRTGSSRLDTAGHREVDAAIRDARIGTSKVSILGRADPRGPRKFNERLARARAMAVAKALAAAGVPAASITAGTHDPCCDGDPRAPAAVLQQQRRSDVEIILTTK